MTLSTVFIIGAGIIISLGLLSFALPSKVHVEREATIQVPPNQLFELTSSNTGFQTFNPYKDVDPDLEIKLFGPEVGIGSGFSFKGKDGEGTQTISALKENQSVTMQIDLGAKGKPVQMFQFLKAGNGTRVIWSLDANFGNNPIGRIIGLFMDKMMGKTFERGLSNLSIAAVNQVNQ